MDVGLMFRKRMMVVVERVGGWVVARGFSVWKESDF